MANRFGAGTKRNGRYDNLLYEMDVFVYTSGTIDCEYAASGPPRQMSFVAKDIAPHQWRGVLENTHISGQWAIFYPFDKEMFVAFDNYNDYLMLLLAGAKLELVPDATLKIMKMEIG